MTSQIAVRLDQCAGGVGRGGPAGRATSRSDAVRRGPTRSDAVRRGIARLRGDQHYRDEQARLIELTRRGDSVYPDLDEIRNLPHPAVD